MSSIKHSYLHEEKSENGVENQCNTMNIGLRDHNYSLRDHDYSKKVMSIGDTTEFNLNVAFHSSEVYENPEVSPNPESLHGVHENSEKSKVQEKINEILNKN